MRTARTKLGRNGIRMHQNKARRPCTSSPYFWRRCPNPAAYTTCARRSIQHWVRRIPASTLMLAIHVLRAGLPDILGPNSGLLGNEALQQFVAIQVVGYDNFHPQTPEPVIRACD